MREEFCEIMNDIGYWDVWMKWLVLCFNSSQYYFAYGTYMIGTNNDIKALTLNSTVTETYTTAFPGLLGPESCN